jgi:hypothetical protein
MTTPCVHLTKVSPKLWKYHRSRLKPPQGPNKSPKKGDRETLQQSRVALKKDIT